MMSGDSYRLPIVIETSAGPADPDTFSEIEFYIGNVRKTKCDGDIGYDQVRGVFLVDLSQEDTFRLRGRSKMHLRCKFPGGDVIGFDLGALDFTPSISREVI